MDTTGSMGPSITQAKNDASGIVSGVKADVPASQFAIVQFKDLGDTPEYEVVQPMTGNSTDIGNALSSLTASGGHDNPEAHNLVFRNSYTPAEDGPIGWRTGSKKIVVVISDAEPHGAGKAAEGLSGCTDTTADPHAYSTSTELAGMVAMGADRTLFMIRQPSSISTLSCYQSIAARTGGSAVDAGGSLGSQIVSLINGAFTGTTELHMDVVSATPAPATASWVAIRSGDDRPCRDPEYADVHGDGRGSGRNAQRHVHLRPSRAGRRRGHRPPDADRDGADRGPGSCPPDGQFGRRSQRRSVHRGRLHAARGHSRLERQSGRFGRQCHRLRYRGRRTARDRADVCPA